MNWPNENSDEHDIVIVEYFQSNKINIDSTAFKIDSSTFEIDIEQIYYPEEESLIDYFQFESTTELENNLQSAGFDDRIIDNIVSEFE